VGQMGGDARTDKVKELRSNTKEVN